MISVITAFGCKKRCSYCIWKKVLKEKFNFNHWNNYKWIKSFQKNIKDNTVFSISGGGEPLFDYINNPFWDFLNQECEERNLQYIIHTADEKINYFYSAFLKSVIFHLTPPFEFPKIEIPTRFVIVIDNSITLKILERIEKNLPKKSQLSYREIFGVSKKLLPNKEVLLKAQTVESRIENSKFILQGDYNVYLWPNGIIRDKFLV